MSPEVQILNPIRLMVRLAGFEVSRDSELSICTSPLGAGIGIAVYDPEAGVGGVLHALLSDSGCDASRAVLYPGLFMDTGFIALLAGARELNASRENLQVFVAGAAQIMDETPLYDIGKSNGDKLAEMMAQLGMKVQAQALGGRTNCSMELILATGEVRLKYSGVATPKTLCTP